MEQHSYSFAGTTPVARRAHVGVVASGDLEVLIEPADRGVTVNLRTSADGFGDIWHAVLERFFSRADTGAAVEINDFGATPGTVSLRLSQALEAAK